MRTIARVTTTLALVSALPSLTRSESSDAIFSCDTPTATLTVLPSLSYSYSVGNATWLDDGDVAAHYNGTYFTASSGSLSHGQPRHDSGSDAFGAFTSLAVDWQAPALPYTFTTTFKCYATGAAPLAPLIAFSTLLPNGATGAIGTAAEDDPAGAPNGYNSSAAPIVVREGGYECIADTLSLPLSSHACSTSRLGLPTHPQQSTAARCHTSSGRGACVRGALHAHHSCRTWLAGLSQAVLQWEQRPANSRTPSATSESAPPPRAAASSHGSTLTRASVSFRRRARRPTTVPAPGS